MSTWYRQLLGAPLIAIALAGSASAHAPKRAGMVSIPAGEYLPLFSTDRRPVRLDAFQIDALPVTRAEFLFFVRSHPEWRRSRVAPKMHGYLRDWRGDLDPGSSQSASAPVTNVSWYAANAYCSSQGKRLPSVDEWEYVARASRTARDASGDARFRQELLELYTRPRPARLPGVGTGLTNAFGVHDMHGIIWELVLDIGAGQSAHAHHARHEDGSCAAAALGATDKANAAGFLRAEYRKLLKPATVNAQLGFRCAA